MGEHSPKFLGVAEGALRSHDVPFGVLLVTQQTLLAHLREMHALH